MKSTGIIIPVILISLMFCEETSNQQEHKTKKCIRNLEIPNHDTSDTIITHYAYTLRYIEEYEQSEWVAYLLTRDRLKGQIIRTDDFREDPEVATGSATLIDYRGSGYDRGHLAPAADMTWNQTAMSESFFMSNMSPQKPGFNRGVWKRLEEQIRDFAADNDTIFIVTGPVLREGLQTIGPNKVSVPEYYYKVVLDYTLPERKGIGFILPNKSSSAALESFVVTIDSVESLTGLDFYYQLVDSLENALESKVEINKWFNK